MAAYRKADQLLPNHPIIRNNLRRRTVTQLDRKLDACLAGKDQPANPQEAAELAVRAAGRELYRTAFRFYADAFKKDPKLADNPQAQYRYNAACCAALAAAGKGKDADPSADTERPLLRQQALEWLRADLKAYSTLLDKDPKVWPVIQQKLAHWQKDGDLASLRGTADIDKLPEAEREPWRKLWADVDALLKRAPRISPATPGGKLGPGMSFTNTFSSALLGRRGIGAGIAIPIYIATQGNGGRLCGGSGRQP